MNEKLTSLLKNKKLVWLLCSVPLWMILQQVFLFSPEEYKFWKKTLTISGYAAVILLAITLILAPLSKHFPKSRVFVLLNHHKKQTGLACFYYAMIHVFALCIKVILKKGCFPWKILWRTYVIPAEVALLILLALALTSNKYSKIKLGRDRWKGLHRTVYLAEAGVFLHLALRGENTLLWALIIFIPLVAIQLVRLPHKS